jgi:CheY-like chemotaxis protein
MKILGIDDNTDITELLDTVLNGSGHEYTFVNDGKSGVKKIKENQYDLVLLDLAMPGFSGEDVLAELNKEELIKKQKIIIFSASSNSDSEMDELVSKRGAYTYVRKPVDVDKLLEPSRRRQTS